MANSNTDSRANLQKAFDKSKALFFLDITPPNKIEPKTKVIAYIPNYIADVEDSKNALVTAKILPYREKFAEGPENVVRRFRNKELQCMSS
ncbi:hypothetical protein PFICI_02486 [Pestalotiopsis fici W106-1]|uniref:Uncharacterized protein n=1 Tax=Pestalotiopsis fici (strain W106-1 / CGMCC3.15140) TaxID=1229662 RepID=W3XGV7_PESFW|nr:uncharacterized protein PFICI_02486 [Pestalotiopsis fici W106-1]ETS84461.1 hypothetical protein PFICI_02486 [Pestalotiopsis fici W106-1]